MNEVENKINEMAFANLSRELKNANERIVEFEDIKKSHIDFIKKKDLEIKELEHKIEKMKNCGNCNNEKDAGFWSEPFCGISGCVDNDKWEILK